MFKASENDPTINYFDDFYIPLVEIKDFNALIINKPFFDQPHRTNIKQIKSLLKLQETMTKQQGILFALLKTL